MGLSRFMNLKTISIIMAFSLALSGAVRAAGAKTQEVTATVLQTTPARIVVQKGTERWEIDLDPQTKILGELKVGAKVTITYAMSAAKIDAGPNKTQGHCRRGSSSNHFERSPRFAEEGITGYFSDWISPIEEGVKRLTS
jgi:hypothetical protein